MWAQEQEKSLKWRSTPRGPTSSSATTCNPPGGGDQSRGWPPPFFRTLVPEELMDAHGIQRTTRIGIRLRPHEDDLIRRAAIQSRQKLSEYVRDVIVSASQRRLAREEARDA